MIKVNQLLKRWLPAWIVMAGIFTFSDIPSNEMPRFGEMDTLIKKNSHALGYAFLAWASWRGTYDYRIPRCLSGFIALGYAFLDEFHQSFVPGRNASVLDIFIDLVGIVSAEVLTGKILYIRRFLLWNVV